MRRKVTVVGAGNVGATCALELARRDYADVVLVDIIPNFPQGKALDMNQAGSVLGFEPNILGANGYDETEGSDVVVITAGKPRSPGMSRDDLVTTNEAIVGQVTREVVKRSRDAILVVVSNPLDAMCHVAKATSRFKKNRVVGMAGILDTARFSAFIAWETGCSVKDVTAMVLGGHGDQMVPVVSATTVGGVPLEQLVPRAQINAMVKRTRSGGGELVNLLGTSAWYAPGAAAAQMVDAIMLDEKRVLPCTAYLEGEYGVRGLYMGVPVKLGAGGVEEIVKLKLTDAEKKMFRDSAAAVREVVGVLKSADRADRDLDLGLRGKTAIVCGASSGMGLAVAEALAAEGANVAMFARRRDVLEREADRIGALAIRGDLTVPKDLAKLVEQTLGAFGGIDVLVNNGGGPPAGPAAGVADDAVEGAVELLLLSVIRLTNLCLPHLETSGRGRIVNIESSSVRAPIDNLALSNALRPGVVGWMKTLAREVAPKGITVNTIAPGQIDTDRLRSLGGGNPDVVPMGRLGDAAEIASVACFLASDRAAYVTGAVIPVDGGLTRNLL